MGVTVAAQLVAGGGNATDKVRVTLSHPSQDEKRPRYISRGQHVEHAVGLPLDARRKFCPILVRGHTLHLGGVEVFHSYGATPCISVEWKYSSTSILKTLRISPTL